MSAPRLLAELRIAARADCLCLARGCVREAAKIAGCGAELADNLVLAVNEACMNVIQHGYGGSCDGQEMCLQVWLDGAALAFELLDRAAPACTGQLCPRELDDVRPGGLGVHFMRSIMDEVGFAAPPPGFGNRLRMVKHLENKADSDAA